MKKSCLIIDNHPNFPRSLEHVMEAAWPSLRVDTFNPDESGWPEHVDWKHYSIVFIASRMGDDVGLEWFNFLKHYPSFPACVLLGNSGEPDELKVAAKAAGVGAFLRKSTITPQGIMVAIKQALSNRDKRMTRAKEPSGSDTQQHASSDDTAAHFSAPRKETQQRQEFYVDGYDVGEKIAQGGMSDIYLCYRHTDGKQLVMKTLTPHSESVTKLKAVERSHLEFNLISRIDNPHIVKLYDHGKANNGLVYTTMEQFTTGDLKERMQKGITQQQAIKYMVQIAEGLAAIHGCGILHRDLKPANIMFREDDTLAILDFGIAKDITKDYQLTAHGLHLGTPHYMSPEQGNGGYRLDQRSDLYSLGVIFYEMMTKRRPYSGAPKEVIKQHMNKPMPNLPIDFFEFQPLLDKLTGKFPHERVDSAYDLIEYIKTNFRFEKTASFDFDGGEEFMTLEQIRALQDSN